MGSIYGENDLFEMIELAKKYNWQFYDRVPDGWLTLKVLNEMAIRILLIIWTKFWIPIRTINTKVLIYFSVWPCVDKYSIK